jgi:hypothetical protein
MTGRRVLLVGATGVFGRRLAAHLAGIPGLDLVLTSRDAAKAQALARTVEPASGTTVSGLAFDHRRDLGTLIELSPWLVIDASGPFQALGYDLPQAALAAGAHVVDLADARDYILGYGTALNGLAQARGLVALTGASSTPALSTAAVSALTTGWRRIDTIDIAITPGGRSEVGEAVIAAILSYAGRPVPIWREGELQQADAWIDGRRIAMPGLGRRRVAIVETVDAQVLGPDLGVRSRVAFHAGLESRIEQAGIALLARLRRAGWIENLAPLIPFLLAARRLTRLPTSDRGGMLVEATGLDETGRLRMARWSLLAERGDGPHVPTLPAVAAVRALMEGRIAPGARPATGALTLAAIEAEMTPYAITTRIDTSVHGGAVFETELGPASFAALPAPLRALHALGGPPVWRGRADVDAGRNPLVRLIRRVVGMPAAGRGLPVTVTIERLGEPSGPQEIWTRNFAGSRFSSRLAVDGGGTVSESFGPLSFRLGIAARAGGIDLPVTAMSCFGLPMPRMLWPHSQSREYADCDGRFRFDVRLTLPLVGLLAHYRGWLAPAAEVE